MSAHTAKVPLRYCHAVLEDFVHHDGAVLKHGSELVAVDLSVTEVARSF